MNDLEVKFITSDCKDFENLLSDIRANKSDFCRNFEDWWLIEKITKHNINYIVLLRNNVTVVGYACIRSFVSHGKEQWEIVLFCTIPNNNLYGYRLMDHIVNIAKSGAIEMLVLRAMFTAITFYLDFGFSFGNGSTKHEPKHLRKLLVEKYDGNVEDPGFVQYLAKNPATNDVFSKYWDPKDPFEDGIPLMIIVNTYDGSSLRTKIAERSVKQDYPNAFMK